MSKKAELVNLFKEFKNRYETVQTQVAEIQRNIAYTEIGREQAVKQLLDGFAPTVQLYHDKTIAAIDQGLEGLAERWKNGSTGKLFDAGYQAGLANVVKMLEMGAVTEKEDVQNIIDTYTGDYSALALIKTVLAKSENIALKDCALLIPADNREYNRRLLGQLRDNVDQTMNIYTFNQGLASVSMSMDSFVQFVTDRLGDNLELIA
ncbi:hypothetical protein LAD12857_00640 [Lacrimispora amygdalina]|uniref:Uncharacterized protein n=1 Tax=Lacrimispora amygdalina TaxID=253257 RepID=A0ABQ5M0Z4_9FIRM